MKNHHLKNTFKSIELCLDNTQRIEAWPSFSQWLTSRHGQRVQKIPLDAGFSCPNRDGTLSSDACIFCSKEGSGSGLGHLNIAGQWSYWRDHFIKKRHNNKFLAYLQAYSNTYGPINKLEQVLIQLQNLPDIVGLSIGTRPDCFDSQKADLIASQDFPLVGSQENKQSKEIWIEFGVQSCHDKSLVLLNRHHSVKCSEQAIKLAKERGILVCVHLMAGIPQESNQDFLESIDWINSLAVDGVKIHSLYIPRGTRLAEDYLQGKYEPLTQEAYILLASEAILRLNKNIIVHRVTGDPILGTKEKREAMGDLLAPDWAIRKSETVRYIENLVLNNLNKK